MVHWAYDVSGGNAMKKSIGLCMVLVSLFLCSQTVSADLVWGPPSLGADTVGIIGLAPGIILVAIAAIAIIKKIKDKK